MNEIIANWTKLTIGVCLILVTVGFVLGHLTRDDFLTTLGILVGVHAATSGYTGIKSQGQ